MRRHFSATPGNLSAVTDIKLTMKRMTSVIGCLGIVVTAAACSGSPSTVGSSGTSLPPTHVNLPAQGTIAGTLTVSGGPAGPAPGSPRPLSGKITIIEIDTNSIAATTQAKANGTFTVPVPPGVYKVYGQSKHINDGKTQCPGPSKLTVTNAQKATASVVCQIK